MASFLLSFQRLVYCEERSTLSNEDITYMRQVTTLQCRYDQTPKCSYQIFNSNSTFLHQIEGSYLHLRILLFRPNTLLLSKGRLSHVQVGGFTAFQHSVLTGCVRTCVSAKQELITLIHSEKYPELNMPWWYSVFCKYLVTSIYLSSHAVASCFSVSLSTASRFD